MTIERKKNLNFRALEHSSYKKQTYSKKMTTIEQKEKKSKFSRAPHSFIPGNKHNIQQKMTIGQKKPTKFSHYVS